MNEHRPDGKLHLTRYDVTIHHGPARPWTDS
jgi:hypothetical protein